MPIARTLLLAGLAAGVGLLAERVDAVERVDSVARLAGNGIERGVARIVCRTEHADTWRQSRAFVLDTGTDRLGGDLLLAVAHGLPEDSRRVAADCAVYGVHGPPVAIADVWRPSEPRDAYDDWAVLTTDAPLRGEVGRLRLGVLPGEALAMLSADEAPLELLLFSDRSGLGECRFLGSPWIGDEELAQGLFAHSCRTRHGLSGSPIVVGVAGEPVVVGVNVGRKMRPPRARGPLFYGLARAIDGEIEAAVRGAAERALAGVDLRAGSP